MSLSTLEAQQQINAAAELRERGLTAAQRRAREELAARQALLQGGVRRGPNAPADGTFGAVRKSK